MWTSASTYCCKKTPHSKWASSVTHSQLLIFSGLFIQTSVPIYDPQGSRLGWTKLMMRLMSGYKVSANIWSTGISSGQSLWCISCQGIKCLFLCWHIHILWNTNFSVQHNWSQHHPRHSEQFSSLELQCLPHEMLRTMTRDNTVHFGWTRCLWIIYWHRCLYTQHRKYMKCWSVNRRDVLLYGVLITAIRTRICKHFMHFNFYDGCGVN